MAFNMVYFLSKGGKDNHGCASVECQCTGVMEAEPDAKEPSKGQGPCGLGCNRRSAILFGLGKKQITLFPSLFCSFLNFQNCKIAPCYVQILWV